MSDDEVPPPPPGMNAPPPPPGMPPAPPGDAPPSPPGMPPAPPGAAPPPMPPMGAPPAPPMDAPPAPPGAAPPPMPPMGAPPAPPMDAPPAPPAPPMDAPPAPPAPPMDAPPAPPMGDDLMAPPMPPMDAPPAPPAPPMGDDLLAPPMPPMDAPPAPPGPPADLLGGDLLSTPPAPPELEIESDDSSDESVDPLADLGASLASDLLGSSEETTVEEAEVEVTDALSSLSIDSDPVDAGSLDMPVIEPTADHTGARVRPVSVVDSLIGDKLHVQLHEVENTHVSSDGEVQKQKVDGTLTLENPSDKDRLWDLDVFLTSTDNTDFDDSRIRVRELEAGADTSFDYSVSGPQMIRVSEVIDTHPEREKPSFSLSHSDEPVLMNMNLSVENTANCDLTDVKVCRTIPSQFTYHEHDHITVDGDEFVWSIGTLPAGSTTQLSLSADVIAAEVGDFDAGKTTVTYEAASTLSGTGFQEVDGCSRCFSYMNANEGERPDTWACQAVFENKSSFAVDLVLLRVNIAGESEPLFDIMDVPDDVKPGGRWESDEKSVDSRDQPNFSQELTYSVIPRASRSTSGTITMEPTVLTVLEADVSKAMDMAVLKSYRPADINVEMKVKNTGSADINLMRISDDIPGLFASPDLDTVRLDIDGDELLSDMYKVDVKDGQTIEEEHVSPDGPGHTLRITVGTKGPIGLSDGSTLRVRYKVHAPDPSPDNKLVTAPVRVDFSAEKNGPIATRGAEDVPTLRVSHKRRKFNTGKEVFPAGGAGRYEVLVMFHNKSDTALEDLIIHDVIPHGFELKSTRIDSNKGNEHDTAHSEEVHDEGTKVVWNIGVIAKDERIEIMYEILGDADSEFEVKSAQEFHGVTFGDEIDEDYNNQAPALVVEEAVDDADDEGEEEPSPPKSMGFSDNVLDRVMKKHGIEDREGFIAHASSFDDDDNGYLNERELTNAADAWGDDSDSSDIEGDDDDGDDDDGDDDDSNDEVSSESDDDTVSEESTEDEDTPEGDDDDGDDAADESVEEESTDADDSSGSEDDMMDAMMDQLMADSFKSDGDSDGAEVVVESEIGDVEDAAPAETVTCPICQASNDALAAQCSTCSYVF